MFAAVYIPDFSLQAVLRNEPELFLKPVALIDERERKATVLELTRIARDNGVTEGLTSTQAIARCASVLIKSRSLPHQHTATEILLQTAYNFSPRIEATSDGVCTMDLQGLPLFTNSAPSKSAVEDWAKPILSSLALSHVQARIGIAATPDLALHAAQAANPILFVENSVEFVSSLPIETLEPTFDILDVLHRWGIRTIGAFTALGRDKIAERLGPDGMDLFERASTSTIRPLNLVTPSERFSEAMEFEIEIESLQPLLFVLRRFVEQLSRRIDLLHLVIAELRLCLHLASGDKHESLFKIPSPTCNIDVLFRMLQTHLETVRTDSPIKSLELVATPARADNFQFGLFEASLRDPNQFAETLARLTALCGNERVGSPVVEETHKPDAFKIDRPRFDSPPELLNGNTPAEDIGLVLRRFRPAFHADVELRDGEPVFISSLKLSSPIEQASGPFRLSGTWWEPQKLWHREEWDIQTRDGALYRIYHEKDDWFIEGIYD